MTPPAPFPQRPRQSDPYGPESPSRFPTARRDGGAGNLLALSLAALAYLGALVAAVTSPAWVPVLVLFACGGVTLNLWWRLER